MALDIIGNLYDITGEIATELAGWHVNSTCKLVGLDIYLVEPATPRRVMAGVKTYFYTFASEEEANSALNYDGENYNPVFEPKPLPVPSMVTRRQAITVLTLGGYITQIESALSAIPGADQKTVAEIFWKESLHFERDNALLNQLAESIGITQDGLDELFRQSSIL
jgi:hypothetical protein